MKILLVEDDDDSVDMLTSRLARRGYDVTVVRTGEEGLEAAPDYDLILLDIRLPGISGLEVADRLEGSKPIIAVTSYAFVKERDAALEAGCDIYHTKPVALETLIEQIERFRTDPNDLP